MGIIRMALVDDYEVVVRGLAAMMRTYQDTVQIVELNANTDVDGQVDIALFDSFANLQGDRSQVEQLAANPLVGKVVVYSWNLDEAVIAASLAHGAGGYVAKSLPARELIAALREIHRGGERVHRGLSAAKVVAGDWPGREEGLTQREAEVLALITQGFSNADIAEHAGLSINSVKTYIRNCYRRIDVATRAQAVLWGVQHGFLPDRKRIDDPDV